MQNMNPISGQVSYQLANPLSFGAPPNMSHMGANMGANMGAVNISVSPDNHSSNSSQNSSQPGALSSSPGSSNIMMTSPTTTPIPNYNITLTDDEMKTRDKCLYLKQLLQDKKNMQPFAGMFLHLDRILDEGETM